MILAMKIELPELEFATHGALLAWWRSALDEAQAFERRWEAKDALATRQRSEFLPTSPLYERADHVVREHELRAKTMHRPVDVEDHTAEIEDADQRMEAQITREAFYIEIWEQVIKCGAVWTQRALARAGYTQDEAAVLVRQAKRHVKNTMTDDDIAVSKAIAIGRYEHIFRQSLDSMDPRCAILAQKEIDRITGVRTEETGDVMDDLVELMMGANKNPERMERIIDAEVVDEGEGAEDLSEALPKVDWDKAGQAD